MRYALALIVFICVAAPQFLILSGLRMHWENQAVNSVIKQLETAWAVAPSTSPKAAAMQQAAIGERLTARTMLSGGVLHDDLGAVVGTFGQRPSLSFLMWQRNGLTRLAEDGETYLDVYLSPENINAPYHMIIRLDREAIYSQGWTDILQIPYWIPVLTGLTSLAVVFFLVSWLLKPLQEIRRAAISAMEQPGRAADMRLGWRGRDELSETARAVDMLILATSVSESGGRANSLSRVLADADIAVLEANADGFVRTANAAALALFKFTTVAEFKDHTNQFIRVQTGDTYVDKQLTDIAASDTFSGAVTIVTGQRNVDGFMSLQAVRNDKGDILRINAVIVDLSMFSKSLRDLRTSNQEKTGTITQLQQSREELKQLLETCSLLIGGPTETESREELRIERFANEWHDEVLKDGLALGALTHTTLPLIINRQPVIRNIIRQCMLLLVARARVSEPDIHISGEKDGAGSATFTFAVRKSAGARGHAALQWALPYAALRSLLAEASGEIVSLTASPSDPKPELSIRVPLDDREGASVALKKTG
ncbi:hypothetical protein [Coralliovum pocilloporae]|uniref:hypothetical protein n=1 Tax=Coralliovum pocilloporae TaxID=3066369 RepID=UPI003307B027